MSSLLLTRSPLPRGGQWRALGFTACCVVVGFPLFLALGLRHVESVHAAVVTGILPLAEMKSRLFGHWLGSLPFCVLGGVVGNRVASGSRAIGTVAGAAVGAGEALLPAADNPGLFYSTCEDTNSMSSCLNVDEVKKWARTYAKAVAGRTNYFYFNSSTREAELNYLSDPAVTAPTIIFLSEKWIYTSGFSVLVQPPSLQWTYSDDHLVVYHPQNLSLINVTVSISPK